MQSYINIPAELRGLNRWVCWTLEERQGKLTKVPKNPKTGNNAQSDNPATWGTFKDAVDYKKRSNVPGIGFMFNGDGLVGVDIDGCRDPETGELNEIAQDIIKTMDSYTELSQSGKGIHIICRGKLPPDGRRRKSVEMYETGRYFVMTGEVLDSYDKIQERTEQLQIVHQKYINVSKTAKNVSKNPENVQKSTGFVSDDEIVEKALASKNGSLFNDLMNGNWSGHYSSQSEADMALCNLLAFWAGKDEFTMDRLFRQSGLFRDKWDEQRGPQGTYGHITIQEAIDKCNEVYTPKRERPKKQKPVDDYPEDPLPPEYDQSFEQLVNQLSEQKRTFSMDDIGNAERLVAKCGNDIRHCFPYKEWLVWDKNRWRPDKKGAIFEMARQTARGIIEEALSAPDDKRDALLKHARKSCNSREMENMIKQARSLPGIPVDPTEFDNNSWLLAVNNGTVDLKTGKLRPHDRNDMITKISNIDYDPNAKAPIWQAFLDKIFAGDHDLINFIKRAVGYSLTGDTSEQCFFMCYGTGSNGKSTLFNVLNDILNDYARTADMELFSERRNNQTSANEVAMLQGARLVTTVETNDGVRLNEALVKKLTGSDMVTAKKLYADMFEYKPAYKIWMAVNHLPMIRGTDLGIWRRIRIVPFNVSIKDEEKDIKLPEKLRKEYPGILRWAVEGCLDWQKQRLNPPASVLAATDEYKKDQDLFGEFLSSCCVVGEGVICPGHLLYEEYEKWCEISNYHPLTSKRFVTTMREKGFVQQITRSRKYNWMGIGLAASDEMDEAFTPVFWEKN